MLAERDTPDRDQAAGGPQILSDDLRTAHRLLQMVGSVPALIWGRDQCVEDMWNSNSVIPWLLTEADSQSKHLVHRAGGRAPGWQAGIAVALEKTPLPTVG